MTAQLCGIDATAVTSTTSSPRGSSISPSPRGGQGQVVIVAWWGGEPGTIRLQGQMPRPSHRRPPPTALVSSSLTSLRNHAGSPSIISSQGSHGDQAPTRPRRGGRRPSQTTLPPSGCAPR